VTAIQSEIRKTFTTKMWWGLLIPVVLISMVANAFGGLFEDIVGDATDVPVDLPSLLPISLGLTLNQVVVFAAVAGTVLAGGEFRHRTITTTYLTATSRTAVLMAKLVISALLGALYGLAAAVSGSLVGLLAQEAKPGFGDLLGVIAVGALVCALWGVLGAAVALAVGNQVGALLVALIYLLVAESILSVALANAESESVQELAGFLPGNAGDVAVLSGPSYAFGELIPGAPGGGRAGEEILEALTGVANPPALGVAVLVLAVWTGLVVALAAVFGNRRDIT
jgi:hypothetical protein